MKWIEEKIAELQHQPGSELAVECLREVAARLHNQPPDFLTPKQAAERLQVSKDSIYTLISQGLLEHVKVGRLIRIRPDALHHVKQDDGW